MWQMREGDLKGFGCQAQVSALDMGGLQDHGLCPQPGWGEGAAKCPWTWRGDLNSGEK